MTINENLIGINKGDMHMNASRIIEEVRKMASEWTEIAKESEIQQKMIEQIWPNMIWCFSDCFGNTVKLYHKEKKESDFQPKFLYAIFICNCYVCYLVIMHNYYIFPIIKKGKVAKNLYTRQKEEKL